MGKKPMGPCWEGPRHKSTGLAFRPAGHVSNLGHVSLGVSIPANIAEGFRRRGRAEKVRYMNIAEGAILASGS
jgi:hypothetical protein